MDNAGILTGLEIAEQCKAGRIVIMGEDGDTKLDPARINSNSYDLTLGNEVAVYAAPLGVITGGLRRRKRDENGILVDLHPEVVKDLVYNRGYGLCADNDAPLDSKESQKIWKFTIDKDRGWLLRPGIGYLMHTAERVCSMNYVPVLDGKSSIGRLFLTVHVTAGYGDTGFDGQYTLEVVAQHPTIVYPGMRFCQMRFHTIKGEITDYKRRGHYTGGASMGPVPSMTWKQFEESRPIESEPVRCRIPDVSGHD